MKQLNTTFKIILLALAACLALGVGALAAVEEPAGPTVYGFTDIAGTEYEQDITVMCTMGLAVGYTDNSFRPGRTYTRVETAELVIGLLALEAPADYVNPFGDTEGIAGAEAVNAVVAHEFMTGRSEDRFDPYGSVLKAELISVLSKIAQYLGTEDLVSRLDEDLALWAEDFSAATAAEAMHAARSMISALEIPEAEASEEMPSEEMPPEDTGDSMTGDSDVEDADGAEAPAEDTQEESPAEEETAEDIPDETAETPEELTEESPAEPEETEEEPVPEEESPADDTAPSAEPGGEPSAEASEEMLPEEVPAPKEPEEPTEPTPDAPAGVLAPAAETEEVPEAPETPTAAPVPEALPDAADPEPPAATQLPEINPDDPGAGMKTTVYSFYRNLRDQLVSFFQGLLG